MPGHTFSLPARRHAPRSEHSLYCATVISSSSMQYGESFTLCGGFSKGSASLSSEPMKYSPPGIFSMPAGHASVAATTADADAEGAALALATAEDARGAVDALDPRSA